MTDDTRTQMAPSSPSAGEVMHAWSDEPETLQWSRWSAVHQWLAPAAMALAAAVAAGVLVMVSTPARDASVKPTPVQQPLASVSPRPDAEQQLWRTLAADGIEVTNRGEILGNVHSICGRLTRGVISVRAAIDEINQRYPNLGYELAAKSVYDGIDAFCPGLDKSAL
ncbi:DUF732 domain-containing protein [Mycobacterium sp. 852002-30065_SCH5024008]|uniref:DUF732 domain-containing protein n=1 Tax=Mycobacterium sp. 852002-30065_SCH5024008 TaxID=1834088 RepID=UPI0007FE6176|nr:DUF732 domain-containing protein [Mycobacterium sp. 852002-30065_SCH5024008]OBB86066.1 hypothetical protein A5781_06145 [Mycobacterium sp. 852002-30065_SCH5024008]